MDRPWQTMAKRDYYEVLEVPRTAAKDDLKKAYRRLARQYHPDVNKNDGADERFKEINEAYEVLSNDESRAAYDRFGHDGLRNGGSGFGDFGGFSSNMADIFEEFFGGGMGRRSRGGPRRGADLRHDLTLEFDEAVFGLDKEIEIRRPELCPTCYGRGTEPGTSPERCNHCGGSGEVRRVRQSILGPFVNVSSCSVCNGTGEVITTPCHSCSGRKQVYQTRTLKVKVPAGVDEDVQIRLSGEGAPGEAGGPPGNLFVVIHVRKHPFFTRRGNDILLDLEINVAQAALGDEVLVPTVDGEEKLIIPPGTQSGTVFRLNGRGVPYLRRSGRGDQLVVVQVAVPTSLTTDQKALFKELGATLGKEIIPQRDQGIFSQLKQALGL